MVLTGVNVGPLLHFDGLLHLLHLIFMSLTDIFLIAAAVHVVGAVFVTITGVGGIRTG